MQTVSLLVNSIEDFLKFNKSSLKSLPKEKSLIIQELFKIFKELVLLFFTGIAALKLSLKSLSKGFRLYSLKSSLISLTTLRFSELPASLPLNSSDDKYSILCLTY